jgi:acyl transferase domain-containing protein
LNPVDTAPTDFDQIQQQGFYSLLFLGQALAAHPSQEALSLTVVTHSLYDVLGNETLQPAQATVQGICQVLGQEYPHIGCRLVDIIRPDAQPDRLVAQLWAELTTIPNAAVIAYRGPHRWRQTYQPLPPPSRPSGQLRQNGTYAIVGDLDAGLGGFLAASLKQHLQANVVLMRDLSRSSTDLPAQSAAALSLDVDITQVESLRDAVAHAEAQLGPLHGVFYSTPTTNEQAAAPLVLLQPSQCEYNFHSKVHGLVNLAAALAGKSLDFCCVQSSMSAVIGGVGLAAYAGANSFVDAFVQQQNQVREIPWYSVNWDACLPDDASPPTGFGAAMTEFALTPQQVWEASRYLLEAGYPTQVVVSKSDLDARIQQWTHLTPQTPEGSPTAARTRTHARPPLVTAYVAPSNDIEHTLATIWQDLLGLEQVGVNDSFFDLGGHSLLAIQAISRVREAFPPVELEMRSLLFKTPTIAGIAAIIADSLPKPDELNAMAEVLAEVRNLSPEEVRQQLATNS